MSKSKNSKKKCITPLPEPNLEIKTEIAEQNLISSDNSLPSTTGRTSEAKDCIKTEGTSNDSSDAFTFGKDISSRTGSDYFKNSILEEVLSKKTAALLMSPEVVQFLIEVQSNVRKQNEQKDQ
ncbi:hypothetical protein TNIN_271321 [Trichonephila inaurata madagascariensis]|uniref:Regulatory factor X-associated protein RFXANK-binding domain-containing protein n=1 Tax=Trichonephila inaurata madagascariensis TaxID=2747483 RepID=A0A8X6YJK6_9ARAC|nr:hypothetical protein TNIN_271321 [Trichonephila inaurata madagascariensis]